MERKKAIQKIADKFNLKAEEIEFALAFKPRNTTPKASPAPKRKRKIEEPEEKPRPQKFLFLKEDFLLLEEKIKEVHEEVVRLGKEIGASCDESETFHDNFEFEQFTLQKSMWTEHWRRLRKIKNNSMIVSKNQEIDHVGIGNIVDLKINDVLSQKKVGSFLTFKNDDLSYGSLIAKAIIGRRAGDVIDVKEDKKVIIIEVIKIT